MHVHYLSADPIADGVSRGFRWGGAELSTSGPDDDGVPAGIDGLLYDHTTLGFDRVDTLRRLRAEHPQVPVVAVVGLLADVEDVPAALTPYVDGYIERATAHRDPGRALSALRYASASTRGDGDRPPSATCGITDEGPHPVRRRRALRARNRRLNEIGDGLSHDLRKSLMVAEEYADLARETGDEEYLARTIAALERVSGLVEDLVVLTDTGPGLAVLVDVPVATVVDDVRGSVTTGTATLAVGADWTVRGDPLLLRRAFEAALGNAVEHGGPDVTVRVAAQEGMLSIEDDGPGIPSERREVLLAGPAADRDGPAGMGFRVLRDVADAHGWELSLAGVSGGGLRIEFSL